MTIYIPRTSQNGVEWTTWGAERVATAEDATRMARTVALEMGDRYYSWDRYELTEAGDVGEVEP